MAEEITTAFIPKKPLTEERAELTEKKRPMGLLNFLATIIFVASLVAAGGVYFFKATLAKRVVQMSQQLELARGAFEPSLIAEMQILDKRLITARQLLSSHITLSPLFESLQELTLPTVRYIKFEYTVSDEGDILVEISGIAKGYTDISLQSDLFDQNKYIKNQIFSNLTLDIETSNVIFDLTFNIDRELLLYGRNIST